MRASRDRGPARKSSPRPTAREPDLNRFNPSAACPILRMRSVFLPRYKRPHRDHKSLFLCVDSPGGAQLRRETGSTGRLLSLSNVHHKGSRTMTNEVSSNQAAFTVWQVTGHVVAWSGAVLSLLTPRQSAAQNYAWTDTGPLGFYEEASNWTPTTNRGRRSPMQWTGRGLVASAATTSNPTLAGVLEGDDV